MFELVNTIPHFTAMLFASYDENGNVIEHEWAFSKEEAEKRMTNEEIAHIQRIR